MGSGQRVVSLLDDGSAEPSASSTTLATLADAPGPSRRRRAIVTSRPLRTADLGYEALKGAIQGRDLVARDALFDKIAFVVQMTLGRGHPDIGSAASEALEIIWKKFPEFHPQDPDNPTRSASAETWVGRIAWYVALAWRRRDARQKKLFCSVELDANTTTSVLGPEPDPTGETRRAREQFEHSADSGELHRLLARVLEQLTQDERDLLLLDATLDYSVREAARKLGLKYEQAKSRRRRMYERLSGLVRHPPEHLREVVQRLRELSILHELALDG
jgi:DNA-directed RNA polymerase specialized sigma24 family protein